MSADALLWICTLLFAATMLILSAMRRAESVGEAAYEGDSEGGVELGGGWRPWRRRRLNPTPY